MQQRYRRKQFVYRKAGRRTLRQQFGLDRLDDPAVKRAAHDPRAHQLERARKLIQLYDDGRLGRELMHQLYWVFEDD